MVEVKLRTDEYYPWFEESSKEGYVEYITTVDADLWLEYKQALEIVEDMQARLREQLW